MNWFARLFRTREELREYLLILGTCVLGLVGAPWWSIIAPTILLSVSSWPRWHGLGVRARNVHAEYSFVLVMAASFANTCLFVVLAFALGYGLRWLWVG